MNIPHPMKVYVSASSRGLAFDIAQHLAREGADVALSSHNQDRLESARSKILRDSPQATVLTIPTDLSSIKDQERLLRELERQNFSPDVFVCSSGQPLDTRLNSLSREQWAHDLEMILGQAVFAAQRFAPAMSERGYGRFIFISSTYAKSPKEDFFTSSVARAGSFALSKSLMFQYASRGVASFVICLGFIDTPLLRNMAMGRDFNAPDPAEQDGSESWNVQYNRWAEAIPAKRIASPAELANLVSFLISPSAGYLNGNVLSFAGGLDGGLL